MNKLGRGQIFVALSILGMVSNSNANSLSLRVYSQVIRLLDFGVSLVLRYVSVSHKPPPFCVVVRVDAYDSHEDEFNCS